MILVGKKPVMDYVTACLSAFSRNDEIHIQARGKSIVVAVDTAEILRNRFLRDVHIRSIEIGTEKLDGFNGRERNVSTIEICLGKG